MATVIYYTPIDFVFPAELYQTEGTRSLNVQYIILSREPDLVVVLKAWRFAPTSLRNDYFDVEIVGTDFVHRIQIPARQRSFYLDLPQHLFVLPKVVTKIVVSGIEINLQVRQPIPFSTKSVKGTTEPGLMIFNEERKQSSSFAFGSRVFVVISAGERPTGGYSVVVDSVEIEGNAIIIKAHLISPKPTDMVTQAFTYPAVEIELSNLDRGTYTLRCLLEDGTSQKEFVERIDIF